MSETQKALTIFSRGQRESLAAMLRYENNLNLTTHQDLYARQMSAWWRKVEKRPWLYDMASLTIVACEQWGYLSDSNEE